MIATLPSVIQGGMGAGVSGWRLARAVSASGQLGVVSGAGLDQILVRRLQDGDPGGHSRRALDHFPFRAVARRILDAYFVPGGRPESRRYRNPGMHTLEDRRRLRDLSVAGNFVEVFLAREGHENAVGINYLEKITLPLLPSLFGAMLAGVSVVIVGAGIPLEVPRAIASLAELRPAEYPLRVTGASSDHEHRLRFDPREFAPGELPAAPIPRPRFLPVISSNILASMMVRRATGRIDGFIVEGPRAGGHNAPARGGMRLSASGEPTYGPRDEVDLERIGALGLPFWLAGTYGTPGRLQEALDLGAAGIQVGTAFALCTESGLDPEVRRALVRAALEGTLEVFTDPFASPTGFPFKVARLEGTLSERETYDRRERVCDLGFLREAYERDDGRVGFRCPAEPVAAYVEKGGDPADTEGRRCLCNGLLANIGHPQVRPHGTVEPCLLTLGGDLDSVRHYASEEAPEYGATDVLRGLLAGVRLPGPAERAWPDVPDRDVPRPSPGDPEHG